MTGFNGQRNAWFEYAEPGLLTNRTIRNFLSVFKADTWPEVVKLTLLYGVLALQQQFGPRRISLDDIRTEVRRGEIARTVRESLPGIRGEVLRLQESLGSVLKELSLPQDESILGCGYPIDEQIPFPETRETTPAGKCDTPKSPENKSKSTERNAISQEIYPSWWGDGSNDVEHSPVKENPKRPATSTPRLAYSLHKETPRPIDQDDLVTAEHLRVQSSCYGVVHDTRQEHNKENKRIEKSRKVSAKRPKRAPIPKRQQKRSSEKPTSSDRPRRADSPLKKVGADGRGKSATEIADSILTNPWTSFFIDEDDQMAHMDETALTRIGLGYQDSLDSVPVRTGRSGGEANEEVAGSHYSDDQVDGLSDPGCNSGDEDCPPDVGGAPINTNSENQNPTKFWVDMRKPVSDPVPDEHELRRRRAENLRKQNWVMDFGHLDALPNNEKKKNTLKNPGASKSFSSFKELCDLSDHRRLRDEILLSSSSFSFSGSEGILDYD